MCVCKGMYYVYIYIVIDRLIYMVIHLFNAIIDKAIIKICTHNLKLIALARK